MSTTSCSVISELQAALTKSLNWEESSDSIKNPSNSRLELSYDNNNYDITVTKLCPNCGEKMDFGSALRCLKKGLKVARLGWHAKDKYLWYITESRWSMLEDDSVELLKVADSNGGVIKCSGYVSMFLTQNNQPLVLRGWMPTPCDMLAEDWIVV